MGALKTACHRARHREHEDRKPEGGLRYVACLVLLCPLRAHLACLDAIDIKLTGEEIQYLEEPYKATGIFGH